MIQQEIKKYPEPVVQAPVTYTYYGAKNYTEKEIQDEIALAQGLGIDIGSEFHFANYYKTIIKIVGIKTDPKGVGTIQEHPAIFLCDRLDENRNKTSPNPIAYSLGEFLSKQMEQL